MTCPTFQGEGYGKRVVAAATDYIRRSDADLGMLFTGRKSRRSTSKTGGSR